MQKAATSAVKFFTRVDFYVHALYNNENKEGLYYDKKMPHG